MTLRVMTLMMIMNMNMVKSMTNTILAKEMKVILLFVRINTNSVDCRLWSRC